MSEWGIATGDTGVTERTAFEYRELFLDMGIKFLEFHCPFCGVPLDGINLYRKGEIIRSPHFRVPPGEDHRFGCDGFPSEKIRKKRAEAERRGQTDPRELRIPEELVSRQQKVKERVVEELGHPAEIDAEEDKRRRKNAARRGLRAVYRTSLVRSVSEAYLGLIAAIYEQAKEEKWTSDKRKEVIREDLSSYSLKLLDGYKTTYRQAFRNIHFEPPNKPRIFHGKGQVVGMAVGADTIYEIKDKDVFVPGDRSEQPERATVVIDVRNMDPVTGPQRSVLNDLATARLEGLFVRWFAYGTMALDPGLGYRLELESLDHLYIHRLDK